MFYLGHNNTCVQSFIYGLLLLLTLSKHCEIKADIKSYAWVFIEVLKTFNFANEPTKIPEKTIKTLSWNYCNKSFSCTPDKDS